MADWPVPRAPPGSWAPLDLAPKLEKWMKNVSPDGIWHAVGIQAPRGTDRQDEGAAVGSAPLWTPTLLSSTLRPRLRMGDPGPFPELSWPLNPGLSKQFRLWNSLSGTQPQEREPCSTQPPVTGTDVLARAPPNVPTTSQAPYTCPVPAGAEGSWWWSPQFCSVLWSPCVACHLPSLTVSEQKAQPGWGRGSPKLWVTLGI